MEVCRKRPEVQYLGLGRRSLQYFCWEVREVLGLSPLNCSKIGGGKLLNILKNVPRERSVDYRSSLTGRSELGEILGRGSVPSPHFHAKIHRTLKLKDFAKDVGPENRFSRVGRPAGDCQF